MKIITFMLVLFLVGCGTCPVKPEPSVIVETKFIVKTPDKKLLVLPEPVKNIDVDSATQAEASEWLLNKEAYTISLENRLKEIAKFLKDEQDKLDATNKSKE